MDSCVANVDCETGTKLIAVSLDFVREYELLLVVL